MTFANTIAAIGGIAIAASLGGCQTTAQSAPVAHTEKEDHGAHHGAHHGPHIVSTVSNADFATTLARLQAAVEQRGLKTFAVIDHAKGAASIDEALNPTTLVIFGNPRGGTPLMQSAQTLGIVLPLKALVYETAEGEVMISVTDIQHAVKEHGADDQAQRASAIASVLATIAAEAAGGDS